MSAHAYWDSSAAGGATMLASAIGAHLGVPSPERLRRFIEAALRNPDTGRNRNPHRYLGFKDKELLTKQAGFDLEHVTYRLAVVLPRRPDGLILFSHDDAFGRI